MTWECSAIALIEMKAVSIEFDLAPSWALGYIVLWPTGVGCQMEASWQVGEGTLDRAASVLAFS